MSFPNLRSFIQALKKRGELLEINVPVNPKLEIAEIHRRIVEEGGPALVFHRVVGSPFPVVTNLFGTKARVDLAFGDTAPSLIARAASLPEKIFPLSLSTLWKEKDLFLTLGKLGTKTVSRAPVLENTVSPPQLSSLPLLTSWPKDGGPFVTLPLVYTEHPERHIPNLGMYRLQRFSDKHLGLHFQIGKGGGFHLDRAKKLGQKLPVGIWLGGPPTAILAAIAPLPENVPELLFLSLALEGKVSLAKSPHSSLPLMAEAEFAIVGNCDPTLSRPEGPFGDHYGYYSLRHDFPFMEVTAILHRQNAIFPATVVGIPRQEDYYIGEYLQRMLSPLFPLVMPNVKDLWSYGDTGFHSLAAAVVEERYLREGMVAAFRILGEGQLSFTKFLLLTDRSLPLDDFAMVLEHILARANFERDLYVFSNLCLDTLDYTGPRLNEGSRGVLIGMGDPIRKLPQTFSAPLPSGAHQMEIFCPGCLVFSGDNYYDDKDLPGRIAKQKGLEEWPLIVLVDDAQKATKSQGSFLWNVFTRFEPAADIHSRDLTISRHHLQYQTPIVIDARMKPWYPEVVQADDSTITLVNDRWSSYFQ